MIRKRVVSLVRTARALSVRVLRPWRRRSARRRLLRRRPPHRSVLFICHGNICRSPFAAALFASRLTRARRSGIEVSSAGFVGPGRPSPDHALDVARRRGIDLGAHVSQLVTPALWNRADLVVAMDPGQRSALWQLFGRGRAVLVLGDLDPESATSRAITDPIEQHVEVYEACYRRIERCVDALIAAGFPSERRQI